MISCVIVFPIIILLSCLYSLCVCVFFHSIQHLSLSILVDIYLFNSSFGDVWHAINFDGRCSRRDELREMEQRRLMPKITMYVFSFVD